MKRSVRFFSEGLAMAGVLRSPDDLAPGERRPAVLCVQGFSLVKEVWLPQNAERLNRAGYVTLNFDYRHFGESEGEPRCRLRPLEQARDVRNALTFLQTVPEVDPQRVGLFGMSLGASVALQAAATDARVRATVAIAGPTDLLRVWSALPNFERFAEKVAAAKRAFVCDGAVTYVSVLRLLASDPETCALLARDHAKHPTWRQEITFESLADLWELQPDRLAHQISPNALLLVSPGDDTLGARSEMESAFSHAREPKRFVALDGVKHHEIYGDGAGFEPIMKHAEAFYAEFL